MSRPDGHEGDAGAARRALVIDLDELCWTLSSRDPLGQSSHWLNLESGELLFVAEPGSLDEATEDPRDDERWLRIEAIESSDALRIMEDFVDQCDEPRLGGPWRRHCSSASPSGASRKCWPSTLRSARPGSASSASRWRR